MTKIWRPAILVMVALTLLLGPVASASAAAITPEWDTNRTLPCGGSGSEQFNPAFNNPPIVRWDDGNLHKALTIVVFTDATHQELDGHSQRFHYTTTASGPLSYRINAHDVTVLGPICPVPPGIIGPGPVPAPPVWEFSLVVPCGEDPSIHYLQAYGYQITWIGPLQDKAILDTWLDASHIAGPGHDIRWTITTDHAFAGCKLFPYDHAYDPVAPHSDIDWQARLQDTSAPASGH